ncbi:PREDICTED: NADH-cytochrome b5 reductase-like isoform X1 [Acromyrmex echinatior]|uniref:NADH-cytochrome b5 reductase-like isoform X1 n=1 Tax=Acromyrmex echinatior TaxID=103372 RepID=UPI000580F834|nr:PREDICTED: NADH-cytochrome b5 reductase-like isoform X1 [Acromyrmex echinatior]
MSLDKNNDYEDHRPKTPLEEDCCGSGCTPCIFDVHKTLLKEWENRKTRAEVKTTDNLLSLLSYKTFVITDISDVSKDYILICLEYPECKIEKNTILHLTPGQYVMLHSWSKSRPYTPIAWTCRSLIFLVKLYKHGEFSLLLKNASIGSAIDIRGPYGDFKYESNRCVKWISKYYFFSYESTHCYDSFQQITMFGIGSGIAALYPIAKAIVDDETELTRVHLVAGFRSVAHVPLQKELTHLANYWNFKCTLQLSQLNDKTVNLHGFNINIGRLSKALVADYLQSNDTKTTLILICGTSEFNQSIKEWLQEMNYTHIHIFE